MVSEFRWPMRTNAMNNILYTMYVVLHYTARHVDHFMLGFLIVDFRILRAKLYFGLSLYG